MKSISLLFSLAAVWAGAGLLASQPALAQDRIYRCGNEYTNRLPANRKDCRVVEGGNVTVVSGTVPRLPTRQPAASSGGGGSGSPARVVSAPPSAPRNDSPAQRARDADAKAILENELRRAEARQAELVKEYNNGEPDKIGGEARNYQKYLDRVAEMKAAIERNQSDIEGIRRELARFSR
ncbi:MAG: hypothetical protein Q4D74_00585 [Comamonadaceae bacterium]|nr:hypothetical protein [Comamonadaceae bacterium]RRD56950.1 hypothetical protein EII20_08915 [Comamonadaceae bacterium OH2545_COT-014]